MSEENFYISLQYSGIQKTIQRLDRLWYMAGISRILQKINEIELPEITKRFGGCALVAGGGKFTARFGDEGESANALLEMQRMLAITLPMLEVQWAGPVRAIDMKTALNPDDGGLLSTLSEQKRQFRGSGLTFPPHSAICGECGEYPIEAGSEMCLTCQLAKKEAYISLNNLLHRFNSNIDVLPTIDRVYCMYMTYVHENSNANVAAPKIPLNFSDLFSEFHETGERQRMAVWMSDINNMKDKVTIWNSQPEDRILETFQNVKDVFICSVAKALFLTFPKFEPGFLPFRIIIAGGDDLCIVMAEKDVLMFAQAMSASLNNEVEGISDKHPLSSAWLISEYERLRTTREMMSEPKPYCFGSSFIVTPLHTPFRKLHELGEELMGRAKTDTDRRGNSVEWRMFAGEGQEEAHMLKFEKPLFIDPPVEKTFDTLSFKRYRQLCSRYQKIKPSQIHNIVCELITNPDTIETYIKSLCASSAQRDIEALLKEPYLKKNGRMAPERLATLLELFCIKDAHQEESHE